MIRVRYDDIPSIIELNDITMFPIWDRFGKKFDRKHFSGELEKALKSKDDRLFILREKKKIIAFLWSKIKKHRFRGEKQGEIVQILVDPEY